VAQVLGLPALVCQSAGEGLEGAFEGEG
jgi:hypothetical protein